MTDPRYTDPPFSDGIGGLLGSIVGIAAVVVIAAAVFAGINHGKFTVSDNSLAPGMKPPSTTGFGGSSPQSMNPPKRSGPYQ
jgi:hypothetical protein